MSDGKSQILRLRGYVNGFFNVFEVYGNISTVFRFSGTYQLKSFHRQAFIYSFLNNLMATYSQRIIFFTIRIFHCSSYSIYFFYGFRAMLYNCFNYLIFCDFTTITSILRICIFLNPDRYLYLLLIKIYIRFCVIVSEYSGPWAPVNILLRASRSDA